MYEDTPQELVHDLFSEAVFGRHALGRPVIGTADVISSVTKRVLSTYHRQMYAGGNVVIAAAGNIEHNKFLRMLQRAQSQQRPPAGGPRVTPAAREGAAARLSLRQEGHRAVPRLPGCTRNRALRPPSLRCFDPRCDPRRLCIVAALPGDPREAWHGLLRLLVRVAVHRHRTGRDLRRHASREPRALSGHRSRAVGATSPPATCGPKRSPARRRTSKDGSCSRWSRRRTG